MLAGEIERFHAVARLDRRITRRLDQVAKELHVQLVIFDYHDLLGHGEQSPFRFETFIQTYRVSENRFHRPFVAQG
ncbi:hypothetical protein D3C78_1598540 [compost metagenome]